MHLVLDLGVRHRSAEVIFGLDRGRDLLAEHDRLLRRLDRDLEFGLLVFLDAEAAAAEVIVALLDDYAVDAQRGARPAA